MASVDINIIQKVAINQQQRQKQQLAIQHQRVAYLKLHIFIT